VSLIFPIPSTFVLQDARLLSKHYDVRLVHYRHRRDLAKLSLAVARTDVSISWFLLGHARAAVALARRLRRKSIVIAAGYDVAKVPEVGYGVLRSPSGVRRAKRILHGADLVLAVSESTKRQVRAVANRDVKVVYNGVDTARFKPAGQKRRQVLTVAGVDHLERFKVKRLDMVLDVARELRTVQFYLAGKNSGEWRDRLVASAPENLAVVGERDERGLIRLYRQSKVYLQPSAHESFGMSLAEAMACECVPVVSDRYALPEVVGDAGFVVSYGDDVATAKATERALDSDLGRAARRRITERFSVERREKALVHAIESLL